MATPLILRQIRFQSLRAFKHKSMHDRIRETDRLTARALSELPAGPGRMAGQPRGTHPKVNQPPIAAGRMAGLT